MKNLIRFGILILLLGLNIAEANAKPSLAEFAAKANIPYSHDMDIYLIQYAKSGTLTLINAEKNHYLLILNDVNPATTYFSDRPNHIAGQVPTSDLNLQNTAGRYAGFSGVLSYYYQGNARNLNSIVLQFDKYQYDPQKQQIICKVHLLNALPGDASAYSINGVILQFDSGFFDVGS